MKTTNSAKTFCQHAITPITKNNNNFIGCNLTVNALVWKGYLSGLYQVCECRLFSYVQNITTLS